MKKSQEDAVFAVSLDGVNLSDEQLKRIDSGIKEVVMRELAKVDNQGDLVINRKLELNPKFKLPDWLRPLPGIWIEDFDRFRRRSLEQLK
ncbi:MAG: hypothetical protein HY842_07940 [Bacteroidetes bacterium]|nr:hypothetical protein [Bacteroidota bacterium]